MSITWNISAMRDGLLQTLHDAIANAKQKDDTEIAAGNSSVHGTETYPDFKEHSDALETEMAARSVPHTPITW